MGLSGLIGAGANEGLEDILARQLLAQQQAERERAQRAQEEIASKRLSQDASQHVDLMGLRGREQDFRETSYDQETQQQSLDALKGDRDKMDARLTRLTKEDDMESLIASLNEMQGITPSQRTAAVAAARNGRDINPADLETGDDRDAADKRAVKRAGDIATAQESAQARFRKPDAPPRPAVMTPGQKFQATQSLRKSFDMESRAAREVAMQLSQMQAGIGAARKGDMAAGSQAVLVTFQKILDPASVVRESEYARSSSGQALLSRIQGAVEQLRVGGASIPVGELERFVSLANTFAENQARAAMESKEQIEAVATEYGIDPALVTRDIQAPGGAPAPSRSNDGMIRMQAPNGQIKDVPADQVEAFKAKGAKVVP